MDLDFVEINLVVYVEYSQL